MIRRRDCLKLGLAGGGGALLVHFGAPGARAENPQDLLQFLCPPDGEPPDSQTPSPKARPFVAPLFVPPIKQPVPALNPPPDPRAHQRYEEFPPKYFYEIYEQEFRWVYHPDPPYNVGSWSWGFDGSTPGPTYLARYGDPILVRRVNSLPPVGVSKVTFALPSTTSHLHNGHTASESDGSPQDWIDSGEFWDHQYCNFPSGRDPREKLTTLWYHDHRLDFTAANVYAGLDGFYFLFDKEEDTGNENDPPPAWGLPSGKYDVPLILHDVLFDANGQVRWSPFNTAGILGDRYTVNRRIQPFFKVERRKYRFRILNGGPSRFYQLFLTSGKNFKQKNFTVITGDGNFLPAPLQAESIMLSVAQRVDVIIDFAEYNVGDTVQLVNCLRQIQGQGPSGGVWPLDKGTPLIQFQVVPAIGKDPSRVPDKFRPLPPIDMSLVRQERTWVFDYVGGLWTVNGRIFDPNRIDAGIERGTSEIWTIRNGGNNWSHPIHSHFTEYMLLEVNGVPVGYNQVQGGTQETGVKTLLESANVPVVRFMGGKRRDIATLLPGDEIKIYMHWTDFLGKYVMHCHNVVHEDHAMMVRWDIVEPGKGFTGPRSAEEVYGKPDEPPHVEPRPASPTAQEDQGPPPTPPTRP